MSKNINDKIHQAGFDHPCRQTCSGWQQGYERGVSDQIESAKMADEMRIKMLVDRFLAWPLPDSVCSDLCATQRGFPYRSGTTLLTADEAEQMLRHVLGMK